MLDLYWNKNLPYWHLLMSRAAEFSDPSVLALGIIIFGVFTFSLRVLDQLVFGSKAPPGTDAAQRSDAALRESQLEGDFVSSGDPQLDEILREIRAIDEEMLELEKQLGPRGEDEKLADHGGEEGDAGADEAYENDVDCDEDGPPSTSSTSIEENMSQERIDALVEKVNDAARAGGALKTTLRVDLRRAEKSGGDPRERGDIPPAKPRPPPLPAAPAVDEALASSLLENFRSSSFANTFREHETSHAGKESTPVSRHAHHHSHSH